MFKYKTLYLAFNDESDRDQLLKLRLQNIDYLCFYFFYIGILSFLVMYAPLCFLKQSFYATQAVSELASSCLRFPGLASPCITTPSNLEKSLKSYFCACFICVPQLRILSNSMCSNAPAWTQENPICLPCPLRNSPPCFLEPLLCF